MCELNKKIQKKNCAIIENGCVVRECRFSSEWMVCLLCIGSFPQEMRVYREKTNKIKKKSGYNYSNKKEDLECIGLGDACLRR